MNEDEMAFAEPLAGEELERALARYARVRLDPSQAQVRRARAAAMEAAWRRHLEPDPRGDRAMAAVATHGMRPRRIPFSGWGVRRAGMSFAAAIAAGLIVGSSVFAASRAGGPLYESRLALESLALPASAEARVAAQVTHADARLGEAVEAAFRHDDPATAAALDAYDRTIDDLATAEGAAGVAALEAVQFHRTVLLQLLAQTPDDAASGLDRALANSNRVIDRLAAAGGPNGAGGVNGEPQGGGSGPGGVNGEPQGGGSGPGGVNGEPQSGGGGGGGGGAGGQPQDGNGAGGLGPQATDTPAPVATSTPAPPAKTPKPRPTTPSRTPPPDDPAPDGARPTPSHPAPPKP